MARPWIEYQPICLQDQVETAVDEALELMVLAIQQQLSPVRRQCVKRFMGALTQYRTNQCEKIQQLQTEIDRLKAGQFTPEEFQTICHNLPETCTSEVFRAGCRAYHYKLFGFNVFDPDLDENTS